MFKTELLALVVLTFLALFYSTAFDELYHKDAVKLYKSPLYRLLLVAITIGLFTWRRTVGLVAALIILLYYADVGLLSEKKLAA